MAVIQVMNLNKTYKQKLKKVTALNNMSFKVEKGQICGFLGPNGAGKSTTLKIMMDLIRADSGKVLINGIESTRTDSRKKVGFMPENPPYIDSLTGRELLLFSAKMHNIDYQKEKKRADELLEMLELSGSADKKLRNYSKGMIQRIGFASTLIIEPDLLILDEPMSGLDPIGRYKFKNILKEVKNSGTTIFFSSHIIADIEDICNSVIIVKDGRVIKQLTQKDMKSMAIEGYRILVPKDVKIKEIEKVERLEDGLQVMYVKRELLNKTIHDLKGVDIISIEPVKKSLEAIFVKEIEQN